MTPLPVQYFYFHYYGIAEMLGLRGSFDARHGTTSTAVPILFLYGADKTISFHGAGWAKKVAAQEGCKVVALQRAGQYVGHWITVTAASQVIAEMDAWLS